MSLFSRHPRVSFFAVLGITLGTVVAGVRATRNEPLDGRAVLNRPWFDRYPERPEEKLHFLVFLAGGIGLHEEGSRYKFSLELFEFERFGSRLEAKFLDDGTQQDVKFTIERCSDRPPFDACLRFEEPFRGPRTYHGFADDDEMTRRLPWVKGELDLAKSRRR